MGAVGELRTRDLMGMLRAHYRKPGAVSDGEVLITEAQAPGSSRRIDLVRIGFWASRGEGIDAHEIKTSRADWLRELDQPEKAQAWWPWCTRFWIVAPDGVVDRNELPDGWGLLLPPKNVRSRRMRVAVKPAAKEAKVTVALLIELIRRADNDRAAEIEKLRWQHREQLREAKHARVERAALAEIPAEMQRRLKLLDELEQALGMTLNDFAWPGRGEATPADLAPALRDAIAADAQLNIHRRQLRDKLARAADQLAFTSKQLRGLSTEAFPDPPVTETADG